MAIDTYDTKMKVVKILGQFAFFRYVVALVISYIMYQFSGRHAMWPIASNLVLIIVVYGWILNTSKDKGDPWVWPDFQTINLFVGMGICLGVMIERATFTIPEKEPVNQYRSFRSVFLVSN